jgi:hypothetical protein
MSPDEDPARAFLDQTVPREDYWVDREPEEGPARPRHVQHPTEPEPVQDPRMRRRNAIRGAAWTFGPTAGYLAASAALDNGSAQAAPAPDPKPARDDASADHSDYGGDYGAGGEAGSGL